jgi:hypothetical protein
MSAFMTISGSPVDLSDLKPIELIEAAKAQKYIQDLEQDLIREDGGPVYLVHDGSTWTSHNFIGDAIDHYSETGTIEGMALFTLIKRLISNGNNFRIWYADDSPNAHLDVTECNNLEELLLTISEQVQMIDGIEIKYLANKSGHTDAA